MYRYFIVILLLIGINANAATKIRDLAKVEGIRDNSWLVTAL